MSQNGTLAVQCLVCQCMMTRERPLARAIHTHVGDTIHTRYVCETPDCGTEVVIEEDHAGL